MPMIDANMFTIVSLMPIGLNIVVQSIESDTAAQMIAIIAHCTNFELACFKLTGISPYLSIGSAK